MISTSFRRIIKEIVKEAITNILMVLALLSFITIAVIETL